jgi:hypothetical protein
MSDMPKAPDRDATLNPALKRRTETTHDTTSSAAPVDTASVQRQEGRAWPMIWLIVTLLCVAIALYLIAW